MNKQYETRLARLDELEILAELEMDAGWALIDAGAMPETEPTATPRPLLERALDEGLLFVVPDATDRPLGFVAAHERDGGLYVGEIDVWRKSQRMGIGRALMERALAEVQRRGLWGAMLTTDRHAPFNRPFYAKLGFVEVEIDAAPPSLQLVVSSEIEGGHDPARRVAMVHRASPSSEA